MNSNETPLHLLFPLLSSLLFPIGLMFVKKAAQHGAGSWTVTFVANLCAASVFSALWLLGGARQDWTLMWQPGLVALLFVGGQVFTFLAIDRGDVSVATPVLSVKVVLVALLLTIVAGQSLTASIWLAAFGATAGIALIQRSARPSDASRYLLSVAFALCAASCFAIFDVLVQRWAPAWGAGTFLPTMFWMAAALSLGFLPLIDRDALFKPRTFGLVLTGGLLIATQALFLVSTIAFYGDAARINIVYSLRGLWSVLLAWLFARWLAAGEANVTRRIMVSRLSGALLLTAAVITAIAT